MTVTTWEASEIGNWMPDWSIIAQKIGYARGLASFWSGNFGEFGHFPTPMGRMDGILGFGEDGGDGALAIAAAAGD